MKTINTFSTLMIFLALAACKKNNETTEAPVASVNIINASIDVGPLKVNPSAKAISWNTITDQINYGTGRFYYAQTGDATFKVVATADTTKLLVNTKANLTGKLYTLFIFGNSTATESILREETDFIYRRLDLPKAALADSVTNVRFVNLSSNSPALRVNIKDNTANEVTNLAYKNISSWKAYKNEKSTGTDYIFEIRDSATGTLITTYTFRGTTTATAAANLFKSVSLIIRGVYGTTSGANAFGVSSVNHF